MDFINKFKVEKEEDLPEEYIRIILDIDHRADPLILWISSDKAKSLIEALSNIVYS